MYIPLFLILIQAVAAVVYPEELTGLTACLLLLASALFLFFKGEWYLKLSASIILFPIITSISYVTQDVGSLVWGIHLRPEYEPVCGNILTYLYHVPADPGLLLHIPLSEKLAFRYGPSPDEEDVDGHRSGLHDLLHGNHIRDLQLCYGKLISRIPVSQIGRGEVCRLHNTDFGLAAHRYQQRLTDAGILEFLYGLFSR